MRIIVAIDDAPYSKEVLNAVTTRSWPKDTEFRILTVLEPLCVPCQDYKEPDLDGLLEQVEKSRRKAAEKLCEKARQKLESTIDSAQVHYEIREGMPRTEIVNAAVEWSADRILVGAHGRNTCPHNLLGSVSRAVVAHAPCSIEIVRTKRKQSSKQEALAAAGQPLTTSTKK